MVISLPQYAEGVFASNPPLPPLTGPLPQLPVADMNKHIQSIKTGKADPAESTPAAAWRLCSYEVVEALSHYLINRNVEDGLDEGLLNAELCLIPKPGKPLDRLSNLRQLGILRPDAKSLAGAAREALSPCIANSRKHLPQFAYLPGMPWTGS